MMVPMIDMLVMVFDEGGNASPLAAVAKADWNG